MKNKVVYLDITSWRGISAGAIHYYGKLIGYDEKEKYGCKHVKLERERTTQEAITENKKRREMGYSSATYVKARSQTDGFNSEKELREFALKHWRTYFPDAMILADGNSAYAEPQQILYGPKKIKNEVNKLTKEAEKIGRWEGNEKKMEQICDKWNKIMKEFE